MLDSHQSEKDIHDRVGVDVVVTSALIYEFNGSKTMTVHVTVKDSDGGMPDPTARAQIEAIVRHDFRTHVDRVLFRGSGSAK